MHVGREGEACLGWDGLAWSGAAIATCNSLKYCAFVGRGACHVYVVAASREEKLSGISVQLHPDHLELVGPIKMERNMTKQSNGF